MVGGAGGRQKSVAARVVAKQEFAGYWEYFLDEAIFLHLLDASLSAEYPAFREKHAERLTAYVETVVLR